MDTDDNETGEPEGFPRRRTVSRAGGGEEGRLQYDPSSGRTDREPARAVISTPAERGRRLLPPPDRSGRRPPVPAWRVEPSGVHVVVPSEEPASADPPGRVTPVTPPPQRWVIGRAAVAAADGGETVVVGPSAPPLSAPEPPRSPSPVGPPPAVFTPVPSPGPSAFPSPSPAPIPAGAVKRSVPPSGAGLVRPRLRLWRRVRRLRRRVVVATLLALLLLPVMGVLLAGYLQFERLPTVDVASALSSRAGRSGTNYLLVGTDSRAGVGPQAAMADAFLGEDVSGSRTDTIMVLHLDGSATTLTSIPRDLWVADPASGSMGRINSTYAAGPDNLIMAVRDLGIPVDHYVEIDFTGFGRLVDAVGGIDMEFPNAVRDERSGLFIYDPGTTRLDGDQALAYVRSRAFETFVEGGWQMDPTGDLGRMDRQRQFLTSLREAVAGTRNPWSILQLLRGAGDGVTVDSSLTYPGFLGFLWQMRGVDLTPQSIPVENRTTSGGAAVLELGPGSAEVINTLAG